MFIIGRSYVTSNELNIIERSKKRVTLLLGASLTGEKLPPLVIGQFEKPRCFKGVNNLPVKYNFSKKAWMNTSIFNNYMSDLNNYFKKKNKNILMFLDNASCHVNIQYSNIKLMFLPKNTTSILQPMDQGIIHSFKRHYKSCMIKRYIATVEADMDPTPPNILDALFLIQNAWESVTTTTIANCFKKAGFHKINVMDTDILDNDNTDNLSLEFAAEIEEMIADEDILEVIDIGDHIVNSDDNDNNAEEIINDNSHEVTEDVKNTITSKTALLHLLDLKEYFKKHASESYKVIPELEREMSHNFKKYKKF